MGIRKTWNAFQRGQGALPTAMVTSGSDLALADRDPMLARWALLRDEMSDGMVYHIRNVNAYDSRLKGWMFPFRGVATKNLSNYLGWHRYLDVPATKPSPRKFLTGALGD